MIGPSHQHHPARFVPRHPISPELRAAGDTQGAQESGGRLSSLRAAGDTKKRFFERSASSWRVSLEALLPKGGTPRDETKRRPDRYTCIGEYSRPDRYALPVWPTGMGSTLGYAKRRARDTPRDEQERRSRDSNSLLFYYSYVSISQQRE